MSRHELAGRQPRHLVAVGWDPPLQTYFAIVYDTRRPSPESASGAIVAWVGTTWEELRDLDALAARLAPYLDLSPLRHALTSDRRADR